jgi:hypothetical protein
MLATDYLGSNYFTGKDIPRGTLIRTTVVSVRPVEFDDGVKLVAFTDYQGKGVVLNKGRGRMMVKAFGVNTDVWVGQRIIVKRGQAQFSGEMVPAVEIEPIVVNRIAAEPHQALEELPAPTADAPPPSLDVDDNRAMVPDSYVDIVAEDQLAEAAVKAVFPGAVRVR